MRSKTLIVLALALAGSAHAAAMLRCEADDNSVSYVSARDGHANCRNLNMMWQWKAPLPASTSASTSAPSSAPASAPPPTRRAAAVALQPAAIGPLDGANAALPLDAPRRAGLSKRDAATRMYSYVEDGVRHYLTRMPEGAARDVSVIQVHFIETCNFCAPDAPVNVAALLLDKRSFQREIEASAAAFGVDSALVRAVIQAESAYRSDALSRAGAQGLMQLMPSTALRFNVDDPFDAAQNIRGGVQYLSWLLRRFGNDLDRALAAYNSGEAAVDRYDGVPPYAETRTYVARVKALADRYRSGR
jgi:soluble lytic murein transglycosylase-like protein